MKSFANLMLTAALGALLILTGCTKKQDASDNSLYVNLSANVPGLDPIQADNRYSNIVVSQIYEGLLGSSGF